MQQREAGFEAAYVKPGQVFAVDTLAASYHHIMLPALVVVLRLSQLLGAIGSMSHKCSPQQHAVTVTMAPLHVASSLACCISITVHWSFCV
jgi:hypothetical protein